MKNEVTYTGTIIFDPKDYTTKHKKQSSWKKIAIIQLGGEICEYYGWFIRKRYGITLNPPIRGAHISFINDHIKDLNGGFYNEECGTKEEREKMWLDLKKKYHNTRIKVTISTNVQTSGEHVWLRVEPEHREEINKIRSEIGLPLPNLGKNSDGTLKPLGIHMTIGYAVDGRVNIDEFEDGVMKSGRMNLENLKIFSNEINKR